MRSLKPQVLLGTTPFLHPIPVGVSVSAVLILAIVLMLIGSFAGSAIFVLGILVGVLVLVATWIVPVLVAFYHYVDDDYFEAIKGKNSWALMNRLLLIVPKS